MATSYDFSWMHHTVLKSKMFKNTRDILDFTSFFVPYKVICCLFILCPCRHFKSRTQWRAVKSFHKTFNLCIKACTKVLVKAKYLPGTLPWQLPPLHKVTHLLDSSCSLTRLWKKGSRVLVWKDKLFYWVRGEEWEVFKEKFLSCKSWADLSEALKPLRFSCLFSHCIQ